MKKWFLTVLFVGVITELLLANSTFNLICLLIAAISLIGFPPGMILAFSLISLEADIYDIQHNTGLGRRGCLVPAIFKSIPTLAWVIVITGMILRGPAFIK